MGPKLRRTFITGAQKCTVFGPTGLFHTFAKPPCCCVGAAPSAAVLCARRWKAFLRFECAEERFRGVRAVDWKARRKDPGKGMAVISDRVGRGG